VSPIFNVSRPGDGAGLGLVLPAGVPAAPATVGTGSPLSREFETTIPAVTLPVISTAAVLMMIVFVWLRFGGCGVDGVAGACGGAASLMVPQGVCGGGRIMRCVESPWNACVRVVTLNV
jgi:hypothetical protein